MLTWVLWSFRRSRLGPDPHSTSLLAQDLPLSLLNRFISCMHLCRSGAHWLAPSLSWSSAWLLCGSCMNKVSSRACLNDGEDFFWKTRKGAPSKSQIQKKNKILSLWASCCPEEQSTAEEVFFFFSFPQLTWVLLGYSHAIWAAPDSFGHYPANGC